MLRVNKAEDYQCLRQSSYHSTPIQDPYLFQHNQCLQWSQINKTWAFQLAHLNKFSKKATFIKLLEKCSFSNHNIQIYGIQLPNESCSMGLLGEREVFEVWLADFDGDKTTAHNVHIVRHQDEFVLSYDGRSRMRWRLPCSSLSSSDIHHFNRASTASSLVVGKSAVSLSSVSNTSLVGHFINRTPTDQRDAQGALFLKAPMLAGLSGMRGVRDYIQCMKFVLVYLIYGARLLVALNWPWLRMVLL